MLMLVLFFESVPFLLSLSVSVSFLVSCLVSFLVSVLVSISILVLLESLMLLLLSLLSETVLESELRIRSQLTSARNVSPQNNLMYPFLTIRHLSNHSLQFLTTGNYVHIKTNTEQHVTYGGLSTTKIQIVFFL